MRILFSFVLNAAGTLALGLLVAALLGPAAYGRYAVGSTVAVVLALALFDWLRLSTTRYYGETVRGTDPGLRATLDTGYLGLAALLCAGLGILLSFGVTFGLGAALLAAAAAGGLTNGLFDFHAALARARFRDRSYAVLMLAKNGFLLALGVGAAALTHDPAVVLGATAAGALLAFALVWRDLGDPGARLSLARRTDIGRFARYGIPVVAANVVFQIIVLMNRSTVAAVDGYAAAGALSLATDLGLRFMLAVGAAVDTLVFQLAVRKDHDEGFPAAERQLRTNATVVIAVLTLLAVGYAMALPAFEAVLVPARYRGPFGTLSLILLPGVTLFCVGQFALNPVFQIAGRTGPVVLAALVALAADAVGLLAVPHPWGVAGIAAVHSGSLVLGSLTIVVLAHRRARVLPGQGDLARILLAALLTALVMWPLRSVTPAFAALAAATGLGAATFLGASLALDLGGLRAPAVRWFARRQGRAMQRA